MTNIHALHEFCATLPGATHDHKWRFGDSVHPVYSVGGRMFAIFSLKAGQLRDSLLFKVDDMRFLELTDRDGIEPAGHLARAKWVSVKDVRRLSDAELRQLLVDAHGLILAKASKKMQATILEAAAGMPATRMADAANTPARGKAATGKKVAPEKVASTKVVETVKASSATATRKSASTGRPGAAGAARSR